MRIISFICLLLIIASAKTESLLIGVLVDISVRQRNVNSHGINEQLAFALKNYGATPKTIYYDEQDTDLMKQIEQMNGFVFQPSDLISQNSNQAEVGNYMRTAELIYNYAKDQFLPLVGVAEGLEVIYSIESGNSSNEMDTHLQQIQQTLWFVPEQIQSYGYLQDGQVVDFLDHRGLSEDSFEASSNLNNNFEITSICVRENHENQEVWTVASFQSKHYPIFAVQFEPYFDENIPEGSQNSFISILVDFARFYMEQNL